MDFNTSPCFLASAGFTGTSPASGSRTRCRKVDRSGPSRCCRSKGRTLPHHSACHRHAFCRETSGTDCDVRPGGHAASIEVPGMKRMALPIVLACLVMSIPAGAEARTVSKEHVEDGGDPFAIHCSPWHASHMQ